MRAYLYGTTYLVLAPSLSCGHNPHRPGSLPPFLCGGSKVTLQFVRVEGESLEIEATLYSVYVVIVENKQPHTYLAIITSVKIGLSLFVNIMHFLPTIIDILIFIHRSLLLEVRGHGDDPTLSAVDIFQKSVQMYSTWRGFLSCVV